MSIKYIGTDRHCPVCNRNSRLFGKAGINPREDAICMHCGAVERHRLVWLFFKRKTNLFNSQNKYFLHIAPEAPFERQLRNLLGKNYLTADLLNPNAMVKMDITDIKYPNESFDIIYCSHVLEHVPDDKKAISEVFRVLKTDGWAVILVPIIGDVTFEDLSITDPQERIRLFGDEGHVRNYGRDYTVKLRNAGFYVQEILPTDFLSKSEIIHMGITSAAGEIYFCSKQEAL